MFWCLQRILRRVSWEWGNIWTFWLKWDLRLISDSNDLSFWGIIRPLILPEVIVTWVFTRWHFLASALLIISSVIKHSQGGTSDLKLRRWCGINISPHPSHILGPQRTKKHSKRELKHYLILKIWGKHHIRSKSDQLSHSVFNKWWWCFSVAAVQGSLSSVCEFILIHSPFFLGSNLQEIARCVEDQQFQIEYKGEKPVQIQMRSTYQNRWFQKR